MILDLTPQEIRRFYGKLYLRGCGVTWQGPVNNHGYGRFEIYRGGKRVRILAHRLAFKLASGVDPGRAVVRHDCDTPACCTPDCLTPGTQADNIDDAFRRGRMDTTGLEAYREERDRRAYGRLVTGLKRCSKCGVTKSLDDFFRNRREVDGRGRWCKACRKQREVAA